MKFLKVFVPAFMLALAAFAQAKVQSAEETAGITPLDGLVPFDDLFRGPVYSNIKISPDGKHFAAGSVGEDGDMTAVIIDRKTMSIKTTMKIEGRYGIGGISWANKERVLFQITYDSELSEGAGGSGMVAAMNVDGTRKDIIWGKSTKDGPGQMQGKLDREHYLVQVWASGGSAGKFPYTYLYKVNIYTGKATRLARSPIRGGTPVRNKDGEITHWVGVKADSFKHTIVATKNDKGGWDETMFDKSKGEFVPRGYSKDGKKMLYVDTIEAPTRGLYWVDLETGEKELVYRHPKVDITNMLTDDNGDYWGAVVNYDYPEIVYLNEDNLYAKTMKKLQGTFTNKWVRIENATADGNEWLVRVADDRHPAKYYLYNQFDGTLKFMANGAPWIDPAKIPPTHPFRFTARDGLEINGYITMPLNAEPENLPLIVLPHGGPHGPRDYWGFHRERIVFANAGYAVMQVNFRGSGGYGREFEYDWYGHWGLEMQDDLTDATNWAIESGIADKDRICMYGASYGGYATLMGLVKEPDMYQCGIGYVGVYDLNTMMKDGDVAVRKAGINYMKEALGATEEKRRAQSSTPHVDRIKKPVFLIQGARDVRAHWNHYRDMRKALLNQDHRLETLVAPRAAHGARNEESQKEIYCRMIDFFDRHIGDKKPMDAPAQNCVPEGAHGLEYEYFKGVPRG